MARPERRGVLLLCVGNRFILSGFHLSPICADGEQKIPQKMPLLRVADKGQCGAGTGDGRMRSILWMTRVLPIPTSTVSRV